LAFSPVMTSLESLWTAWEASKASWAWQK